MVRYATCIEVIFLTAGRPSGAALLRLGLPLASVPTEKKYALLRIGLRDDTPPRNGCCRVTESYASGTC